MSISGNAPEGAPPALPEFLQRWQSFLTAQSRAFASLKQEQQAGWQSPALDALYNTNNDCSKAPTTAEVGAPAVTHFKTVDVEQLCDRYRKHAHAILLRTDSTLFGAATTSTDAETLVGGTRGVKFFADLGSAPGGVSAFLSLEQGWWGVGVSLAEHLGGIGMTRLLTASDEAVQRERRFTFVEKSILDVDLPNVVRAAGQQLMEAAQLQHQPPADQRHPPDIVPFATFPGFDFVNGGAVQDHGQRLLDKQPDALDDVLDGAPILPWFHFLVPQLLTALTVVRRDGNGAVMVVYGMSQCGSLLLLLHLLVEVLHIVPSYADVDFLETIHLTKPPIYVVLKHVVPTDESLRRLAQYFSWSDCEKAQQADGTHESLDGAQMLSRQQRWDRWNAASSFWHLDGAQERAAAERAFANCGTKLEALWARAEGYLRQRREKAERLFAASQRRSQQSARGFLPKRPRE